MVGGSEKRIEKWQEFFNRYCKDQLDNLADKYPDLRTLVVEYPNLERYDIDMAEDLLESPRTTLEVAHMALADLELGVNKTLDKAHVRIANLPSKTGIRDLRSQHISKLIAIEGMVRKATEVRPRITNAAFECQRCNNTTFIEQTDTIKFTEPLECENEMCLKKGPFKIDVDKSTFVDAQKLRLQESPENLRGGEQPQTLDIDAEDDIAGVVAPGDRLVITGILKSYQRVSREGKSTFFDIILESSHIEREDKEYDELEITEDDVAEIQELASDSKIYSRMVSSIAPSIYGNEDVKEALLMQLFSGIVKNLPDGSRIRGDIHMLLVGDPGIAKSQLLRYAVRLAPRGVYTSGKSATSAGLTAAAVKDDFGDGRWTLEAGALVLADMGVAAVDEMDKMSKEDRSALHEAMEQQTVSVAKAGIMATLKSRCALLGAANPRYGRFDTYQPLAEQIRMPPALLSRFDLIFILMDKVDHSFDSMLANHVIGAHHAGQIAAQLERVTDTSYTQTDVDSAMKIVEPDIEPEILRKYIAYAKREVVPVMRDEAKQSLIDFYLGMRRMGDGKESPVPVTARQLEALVRLSEASARVRLSNEVTMEDAERTIRITESCLKQVAFDPVTGNFDADMVAVGSSKSQRDKLRLVRNLIKDFGKQYNGQPMPEDELMIQAQEKHGISNEELEEILDKMSRQGEILRPTKGHVKCI